jgi:hypothetical protein
MMSKDHATLVQVIIRLDLVLLDVSDVETPVVELDS